MKGKVIRVNQNEATIGWPDGSFKSVQYGELGFRPEIGDEVEFYSQGNSVVYVQNPGEQTYREKDGKKVVNKAAYALLAILLGDIGVHKFYAGKTGMGIVYLLFCWTFIPGIIGLIEGLVALGKKSDSEGNILM